MTTYAYTYVQYRKITVIILNLVVTITELQSEYLAMFFNLSHYFTFWNQQLITLIILFLKRLE